ncbi:hypothetical protein [Streptomyces iconiensis]|uniref:Uncharacterized protein n=1 Tax=Streptomyces iconiensis TaxID=1384038 RepID=A0ABT6ZNX5_9ACTN|nr:hypothetical protein [Streptomyces iconiensis]MDJ1130759.1 hypothetical protein [Streptomyces iconiensis]
MASEQDTDLAWHDVLFRVRSEVPEAVGYVRSQHRLATAPPARAVARIDVRAVRSREQLEELSAAQATEHRESYAGWWYRCHRDEEGAYVLVSDGGHEFAHALRTPDFRSWEVVTAQAGELGLVVTRTVRELVREHFVGRGALMLHGAAAVLPDGTGLVLAGSSGAGKTSIAVQAARAGGSCVATDRVLLLPDGPAWIAVGLPMSTRLTAEAALTLGIAPGRSDSLIRHGEAAVRRPDPKGKISLSNEEMYRLAGVEFTTATRVDQLMLLENTGVVRPVTRPLPAAEAGAALREHILVPDTAYRSRWLAADPRPEPAGQLAAALRHLVGALPARHSAWTPATHERDFLLNWLTQPADDTTLTTGARS